MKTKIGAFLAAWIIIASNFAFAQGGITLSGKITGAKDQVMDGATVYLLRSADSVLVKSALTDATGNYLLENLKTGQYKLSVTMMGYRPYQSAVINLDRNVVLPVIVLTESGTALSEITLTAKRPFVEHKIDRTVVNVDALISNAGSNAFDVLEKAPGIILDQGGAISLKGKNVTIFIDDKPTNLSGADLENYLRSLSSSTIDQIELMSNPPAKYDAAGNGGVINIRTKRSKVKGFNGSANLSYSQGKLGRTNNSLNFNYRNNRLNVTGNFSFAANYGFNDLDINRHFVNSSGAATSNFLQNSYIVRKGQSYNARIGVDYYVSDKTTLGAGFSGVANPLDKRTHNVSQLLNALNQQDSSIVAENREQAIFKNGTVNLNYRHQYDKNGRELTADVDYLNYRTDNDQSFDNTSLRPDGSVIHNDLLTGSLPASIHIYSAKTDYSHPLKNGVKLAAGLKTSYTKTDNIADYFYTVNGITRPDYDKTNHFIYEEHIHAAYVNANKDFKRWSVQAGLRFENTLSNGHQLGNVEKADSVFKRDYAGLFPTLYLQYKLDTANRHQLSFNYSRRIDRPYYQDLNPFVSPLDKFTFYVGNPFLRPSYTNNFELSHTYKSNFTTTIGYSKSLNQVNETIEINDGIYYSRPGNIGTFTFTFISVDGGLDLAKWFNVHLYTQFSRMHSVSDFYTGLLDTKGNYFFIRPVMQFTLKHDWSAQLDGGYQTKVTNAQFIAGSRGRINAAVSKKLSASTTLKLVGNDIFYTFVNSGVINNLAQTKADYRNLSDTRNLVVSLSYRFGKAISGQRKHDANGAETEQNRVKN